MSVTQSATDDATSDTEEVETAPPRPLHTTPDDCTRWLGDCPDESCGGDKWRHVDGDVVCDQCFTVVNDDTSKSAAKKATDLREARYIGVTRSLDKNVPCYDSGNVRLLGGFVHAYDGEGNYELGSYDDDGLTIFERRDWSQG